MSGNIPADIDQTATDIVRADYTSGDEEPDWLIYRAIAKAILAERDRHTPAPIPISVGAWRVFEDTDPQYCGIELEQAGSDDEPIMYPIRVRRDTFGRIVEAHNAEIARLESLHRSEIADMAERFRSVNVSEAMKQLADILPAASAEHVLALEKAAEALSPLADAVFNDNSDMTVVSVPLLSAEDCIQAYFAVKRIRASLNASEAGNDQRHT